MFMVLRFLTVLIFLATPFAYGKKNGIKFEGALGRPAVTMSNPDNTLAGFSGLSVYGRVVSPIGGENDFSTSAYLSIRYHDLENNKNSATETEVANHLGPALGLVFKFSRLYLSYDYALMKARHYYIGNIGRKTEFDYTASNITAGFQIPFGDLSAGFAYTYGTGVVGKSDTGMTKDSDLNEQTIWLTITYSISSTIADMTKGVLK
jgi:hypothetical protein